MSPLVVCVIQQSHEIIKLGNKPSRLFLGDAEHLELKQIRNLYFSYDDGGPDRFRGLEVFVVNRKSFLLVV